MYSVIALLAVSLQVAPFGPQSVNPRPIAEDEFRTSIESERTSAFLVIPQGTAGGIYLINNSAATFACEAYFNPPRIFEVRPGNQWLIRADQLRVRCRAPASDAIYQLWAGRRYSFLRNPASGLVDLREITLLDDSLGAALRRR